MFLPSCCFPFLLHRILFVLRSILSFVFDPFYNPDGDVCFRGRKWAPEDEHLGTTIVQEAHDSVLSGHPGREGTYRVLSRQFYWPSISDYNRRFCTNCDQCRANQIWRDRKHGLLKPLPIPERKWRDISMDFVENLPLAGSHRHILVITDRLTRGVILGPMVSTGTEATADAFIRVFYRRHCYGLRPNCFVCLRRRPRLVTQEAEP